MLAIRVLESVYASYHFVVGNVDRHGFDTSFVVDRCFGENRHEIALAHEVEQYVGVVQFYPCFKVEFVAFEYLVEHITRLKPFGG